jgi:hypothetical protein
MNLILAPILGFFISSITWLTYEFRMPQPLMHWCQRHKVASLLIFVATSFVTIIFLPVQSRIYLNLNRWKQIIIRYSQPEANLSVLTIMGQLLEFTPLVQQGSWIRISKKTKNLDLTIQRFIPGESQGGPISIEISRVDGDTSPNLWYLVPVPSRERMRRSPRFVYKGDVLPGTLSILAPSSLCWLYSNPTDKQDPKIIIELDAPLYRPITITKETSIPILAEPSPPFSKQTPAESVFDISSGTRPFSFTLSAAGPVTVFCHGLSFSNKDAPNFVGITGIGLKQTITVRPDEAPSDNENRSVFFPGILIKLGAKGYHTNISGNSIHQITMAAPNFNLGNTTIDNLLVSDPSGVVKIDTTAIPMDAGDDISIVGKGLKISYESGKPIVEGYASKILHNNVVKSKRLWSLIPDELKTVLISVLTSLVTTFLLFYFKREPA